MKAFVSSSARAVPKEFRLTTNDFISERRGSNLRMAVPKLVPSLTYTPPKTNNHKNELLHSFPIKRLSECVLPLNSSRLTNLVKKVTEYSVQSRDDMMEFYLRVFPEHTVFQGYQFQISNQVRKMLMHVFSSIDLSNMVPFAHRNLFSDTRICTGLQQLLERTSPFQKVMEFFTIYKGMYGHLILFVSLGVGCTVWYTFLPEGPAGSVPPETFIPGSISYERFKNIDFHLAHFKKASYIEYKYITDQVLSALENVYPFTEINLPSINPGEASTGNSNASNANYRVAVGLGIIVAFYLSLGMMPYENPELDQLIAQR